MTLTPVRRMTFEEYLALPEDEELRHAEFVDGEVIVLNRPHGLHQRMQLQLAFALRRVAPVGYEVLTEWDWVTVAGSRVRDPELLVLRSELVDAPRLTEPPLLAVEVLSERVE
ncbi:MAG: Uma2 family endonuclease [Actinomycetota bacterium]|nr:Uma2 family endonuclease [Actinomycetota bacterium]